MQSAANSADDNNMLAIATISTTVANNSAPNIFNVFHLEPRRLMHVISNKGRGNNAIEELVGGIGCKAKLL